MIDFLFALKKRMLYTYRNISNYDQFLIMCCMLNSETTVINGKGRGIFDQIVFTYLTVDKMVLKL